MSYNEKGVCASQYLFESQVFVNEFKTDRKKKNKSETAAQIFLKVMG